MALVESGSTLAGLCTRGSMLRNAETVAVNIIVRLNLYQLRRSCFGYIYIRLGRYHYFHTVIPF